MFARLGSHMTGESLREYWSCNVPTDTCSPGAMPVCLRKYVLRPYSSSTSKDILCFDNTKSEDCLMGIRLPLAGRGVALV